MKTNINIKILIHIVRIAVLQKQNKMMYKYPCVYQWIIKQFSTFYPRIVSKYYSKKVPYGFIAWSIDPTKINSKNILITSKTKYELIVNKKCI